MAAARPIVRLSTAQRRLARARAADMSRATLEDCLKHAQYCATAQRCPLCRRDAKIYARALQLQEDRLRRSRERR